MRRLVLSMLLAASFAGSGLAQAEPLPTGTGCTFQTVSQDGVTFRGVMWSNPVAAAELPGSGDPLANPVSITIHCTLHVAGDSPDPAIPASGSGTVVAVVAPTAVTYHLGGPWDYDYVCTSATVTDANGTTRTYHLSDDNRMWRPWKDCDGFRCLALGPNCDHTLALLDWVLDRVWPTVDGTVCPAFAARAPGVPGVVDIRPDGDVYVGGEWIWDCPPLGS